MRGLTRAALTAGAVGLALGTAEAAKGPKKPDTPFVVHVFTRSADKGAIDSAADVRQAIEKKKADWFRLTDDKKDADIVLEITRRDWSRSKENMVYGRLTTANLDGAEIIGQAMPGILDMHKPWRSAAENMAGRLERFCRDTYADMAAAQKKKASAGTASR